jgi:hypothetical protein
MHFCLQLFLFLACLSKDFQLHLLKWNPSTYCDVFHYRCSPQLKPETQLTSRFRDILPRSNAYFSYLDLSMHFCLGYALVLLWGDLLYMWLMYCSASDKQINYHDVR